MNLWGRNLDFYGDFDVCTIQRSYFLILDDQASHQNISIVSIDLPLPLHILTTLQTIEFMADLYTSLPNYLSLQSLLVLSEEQAVLTLHKVIDNILGRNVPFTDITANSKLSIADMDRLASCLDAIVVAHIGSNWSQEQLAAVFAQASLDSLVAPFTAALNARRSEVRQVLIENTSSLFPSVLEDIDWSVRLTVASSKAAAMRQPIAVIALALRDLNGTTDAGNRYWVRLELNEQELQTLIDTMSKPLEIAQC